MFHQSLCQLSVCHTEESLSQSTWSYTSRVRSHCRESVCQELMWESMYVSGDNCHTEKSWFRVPGVMLLVSGVIVGVNVSGVIVEVSVSGDGFHTEESWVRVPGVTLLVSGVIAGVNVSGIIVELEVSASWDSCHTEESKVRVPGLILLVSGVTVGINVSEDRSVSHWGVLSLSARSYTPSVRSPSVRSHCGSHCVRRQCVKRWCVTMKSPESECQELHF